jgi:hypothetical protein
MNQILLLALLLSTGRPRGRRLSREIYQILTTPPFAFSDVPGAAPTIHTSNTTTTGSLNDLVEELEDLLRSRESGQALRLELLLPILLGLGQQPSVPAMPAPTTTAPAPVAAPAIDPTMLLALVLLSRPNDLS